MSEHKQGTCGTCETTEMKTRRETLKLQRHGMHKHTIERENKWKTPTNPITQIAKQIIENITDETNDIKVAILVKTRHFVKTETVKKQWASEHKQWRHINSHKLVEKNDKWQWQP